MQVDVVHRREQALLGGREPRRRGLPCLEELAGVPDVLVAQDRREAGQRGRVRGGRQRRRHRDGADHLARIVARPAFRAAGAGAKRVRCQREARVEQAIERGVGGGRGCRLDRWDRAAGEPT
ncbi:MAG: hypothetical protein R2939_10660 [Kofleriaceae bacterium]